MSASLWGCSSARQPSLSTQRRKKPTCDRSTGRRCEGDQKFIVCNYFHNKSSHFSSAFLSFSSVLCFTCTRAFYKVKTGTWLGKNSHDMTSGSRQNGEDSCRPIFQTANAIILAAHMQLKSFVVCNFTFTMPTEIYEIYTIYENIGYHLNHTWTPLATCLHSCSLDFNPKHTIHTNIWCFLFGLSLIQPLAGVLPYKGSSAFVIYFEINRKRGGLLVASWGSAVRWLPDNFFPPPIDRRPRLCFGVRALSWQKRY